MVLLRFLLRHRCIFRTQTAIRPFGGNAFASNSTPGDDATQANAPSATSVRTVRGATLEPPAPASQFTQQDHPLSTNHKRVKPEALEWWLRDYPESDRNFLVNGFKHGFRINYNGPRTSNYAENHGSATKNQFAVAELIQREVSLGRIAGPFQKPPFTNLTISPLGLVPKKEPDTFRLIHDLSFPRGNAVNDHILPEDSTVQYENLDQVIHLVKRCGRESLIAKCDIEEAFRQIPIHPSDYSLLGFMWDGKFYYDKFLPMGCSSSCQIFERFSIALQWIIQKCFASANVSHILDDFIFVGPPGSPLCKQQLELFISLCSSICLPIKHSKTVHPCNSVVVHGFLLDTISMHVIFPPEKIHKTTVLLQDFSRKRRITLRELQSICGLLNFACRAVAPGRTFLRRIIDLTRGLRMPHHYVRLSNEARADALAWLTFLQHFNGTSMFLADPWISSETLRLGTDASGIGYAGVFGKKWFMGLWPTSWSNIHITAKELFPILVAMQLWSPLWRNHKIIFFCDNSAVVDIINMQSCRDKGVMDIVRKLVVIGLQCNILFRAKHIPGKVNVICDKLSRDLLQDARKMAPWLEASPTIIPNNWLPT
jgi:hypothetical protein